ncbi:MAG: TolC family protein [Spirochaetaceae bacterium]|jgi:outer membrane protein TolC|nr:TolC family protein [Spirochaetaceae bacterium]
MKRFLLLTVICAAAALCSAQEKLTLEKARDLGVAASRELAAYRLKDADNVLTEKTQFYTMLPSPSLGASASMTVFGENVKVTDTLSAGLSAGVSQTVYDGGKYAVQRAINRITSESTRADALGQFYTVLGSVDAAYYDVLKARASLDAAETSLESAALALSIAEIRRESGIINQGDYLKALADKESGETGRIQARRALTLAETKLCSVTALPSPPEIEEVDFTGYEELIQTLAALDTSGLDSLYGKLWQAASGKNPAFLKAGLNSQQAAQNVTLAKKEYAPTLSASFSTGLSWSSPDGFSLSSGRVSLSGKIPLDYWVTAANVQKKKNAQGEAALSYRSAEETLAVDVQTALLDAAYQAAAALSARRAWEYNNRHYEQTLELYRLGQNSVKELSDAAVSYNSSATSLINARYGFLQTLSTIRGLCCFEGDGEFIALVLGGD